MVLYVADKKPIISKNYKNYVFLGETFFIVFKEMVNYNF